jgi:hypothetical protein
VPNVTGVPALLLAEMERGWGLLTRFIAGRAPHLGCVPRRHHVAVMNRFNAANVSFDRVARLDALATLLDTAFVVPGTQIRFGLDALIGLVPGIGDVITTAISLYLVNEARALGAPRLLVARMVANVALGRPLFFAAAEQHWPRECALWHRPPQVHGYVGIPGVTLILARAVEKALELLSSAAIQMRKKPAPCEGWGVSQARRGGGRA